MLRVSIVTPTFYRHQELPDYFTSLFNQYIQPTEIILVDGADLSERRSENLIKEYIGKTKIPIRYYRKQGGTAIQRNFGIDNCTGDIILFVDDDVRLAPNFIKEICTYFESDTLRKIGGITGYRVGQYFDMQTSLRWIWYKRLRLLKIYSPGKYDYQTGYPINNNAQAQFHGVREVDFMTTACTAYRNEIFRNNFRFDTYFVGFGILEDAHLSLRVKQMGYTLFQCGDAQCIELKSKSGRTNSIIIGERTVTNYYYVFKTVCGPLTFLQKWNFLVFQFFELFRATGDIIRFRNVESSQFFQGKLYGLLVVIFTGLKKDVLNYKNKSRF
jgi:glycosyltransferase involved in cell wall biosynthesis